MAIVNASLLTGQGIHSFGATYIFVNTGDGGAIQLLGTCEDKPQHSFQSMRHKVYGDENGGSEGEPLDVQRLGGIFVVRFTLINKILATWKKVAAGLLGTTGPASAVQPGLFESSYRYQFTFANITKNGTIVVNANATTPRRYLQAVPIVADWEAGTIAQRLPMAIECYRDPSTQTYFDDNVSAIED